jgi:hypothetical protein
VNAGPACVEALRAAALPSSTTSYSGRHRRPDPPASQPCRRSAEPAPCVWPRRGHANPDVDDVPRVVLDEVVVQRSYICGVSQLGQGVRLNLPDPLSGHPISRPISSRLWGWPSVARTAADHAGLSLGQGGQHRLQLVLQRREADRVNRDHGLVEGVQIIAVTVPLRRCRTTPRRWSPRPRRSSCCG